jgi:hypothetical protein
MAMCGDHSQTKGKAYAVKNRSFSPTARDEKEQRKKDAEEERKG